MGLTSQSHNNFSIPKKKNPPVLTQSIQPHQIPIDVHLAKAAAIEEIEAIAREAQREKKKMKNKQKKIVN